jgi:hypothetical protein
VAAEKAKESASSLKEVLERISQARRKLVAGAQGAEETRQLQLAANEAYRQDEVRQREEARRRAQTRPAPSPAAAPAPRPDRSRYNEPLIDSLDVARWSILREIFPRW